MVLCHFVLLFVDRLVPRPQLLGVSLSEVAAFILPTDPPTAKATGLDNVVVDEVVDDAGARRLQTLNLPAPGFACASTGQIDWTTGCESLAFLDWRAVSAVT